MPREPGEFLTSRQVAEMFGVDASTVRKWVVLGQLPAIRTPGGHLRFRREEVEKKLRQSEQP